MFCFVLEQINRFLHNLTKIDNSQVRDDLLVIVQVGVKGVIDLGINYFGLIEDCFAQLLVSIFQLGVAQQVRG